MATEQCHECRCAHCIYPAIFHAKHRQRARVIDLKQLYDKNAGKEVGVGRD